MSRESTDSEGLTDWALVSEEGNLEGDGSSLSGGSSDGYVKVNRDGVVYNRSSSEEASLPESEASPDMSDLLTSSLEEVESQEQEQQEQEQQDVGPEPKELQSSTLSDPQAVSSLAGSIASTGGESAELITDDEDHVDSALVVDLPSSIDITSSVSSLSLVPGLPQASDVDLTDVDAVGDADDDGLISLSTESLTCSKSDAEGDGAVSIEVIGAEGHADADLAPGEVPVAKEEADEGAGVASPGTQWLKYPLENSTEMRHTIRLGDGRVIVAPPGADMESLAASLNLADKSESSSDTGSDSDFVRLDAASSSSSSLENSDSESEEVVSGELPAPDQEMDNEMSASVSSVSSRFRFLPQHSSEGEGSQDKEPEEDEEPDVDALLSEPIPLPEPVSLQPRDSTEPQSPVQPDPIEVQQVPVEANVQPEAQIEDPVPDQQEIAPQEPVVPQAQVNLHALPLPAQLHLDPGQGQLHLDPGQGQLQLDPLQGQLQLEPPQGQQELDPPQAPVLPVPAHQAADPEAPMDDINDGDTESMSGHSEDERTESEQSEAQQGQAAEEEDGLLDDIADVPLVRGRRQYVHRQNKRLNWTLDVVVAMNILLVIGIGIGHFIGSMHEQYINTEVQQAQQSELSLLQDDLLQCHQKTDQILKDNEQLLQSELEQRQEVLEALSSSNSELKEQVKAQEAQTLALGQCRQAEKQLESTGTDLRNEVNMLRHENAELTSRIAAMQYKTVLSQDDTKTTENAKLIEKLSQEVDSLKHENENLKEEIARLKLLLNDQSSEHVTVEEEDEGYESLDEVTEVTSTSCPKVEGHGKVMDLKARINLLEQENADMRAEIGRLRYKSHPGNSQLHRMKAVKEDLKEEVFNIDVEYHGKLSTESHEHEENYVRCTAKEELDAARRQAENWEHLYLNLKERQTQPKKCNSSVDFFTCMSIFTKRINSSINATVIKDFLNITRLLLSVEDVKDAFVNEFQNLWKEFSGSETSKTGGKRHRENSQGKWSDSVKNILNQTQSSMSDVSQHIKQTWNQVKNLSEELWKKHEPSLSKVANKITERVKSFSDHLHTKIHQKANKWFRKNRHHGQDEHQRSHKQPKYQKKSSERKEQRHWKKQEDKREKMMKKEQRKEDKLKKKVNKHFQNMKKLMGEMSEAKHLTMTENDVKDVTVFFTRFQMEWNIHKRLKYQDIQWTLCQATWWTRRLQNEVPPLGLKCFDSIYGWQLEWAPKGKGNFHGIRNKGYQLGKKLREKVLEKNYAEGKAYSYEEEKLKEKDSQNATEWYEQRAKDREDERKGKEEEGKKDWYDSWMRSRDQLREEEHKADWLFDRAVDREESRSSVFTDADSHKGADWMFARAEEREYHQTKPDSWYFRRSEVREEKREKQTAHQQLHDDDYYDEYDDDDFDVYIDDE